MSDDVKAKFDPVHGNRMIPEVLAALRGGQHWVLLSINPFGGIAITYISENLVEMKGSAVEESDSGIGTADMSLFGRRFSLTAMTIPKSLVSDAELSEAAKRAGLPQLNIPDGGNMISIVASQAEAEVLESVVYALGAGEYTDVSQRVPRPSDN